MTNIFTKFQGLIPNDQMDVVEIITDNGDGSMQATTLSGDTVTIKGPSLAVGKKAFIRNGEVIREAPNHSIVELTV